MSAKPIFIVKLPDAPSIELQQSINDKLANKMPDYHVLVISGETHLQTVDFQVFYEKDFNEIKYEELKQIINNSTQDRKH